MESSEFKSLRCSLGLTQDELARMFGMKAQQISNYETGHTPIKASIAKQMIEWTQDKDVKEPTASTLTSYHVPLLSIAASAGYGVMGFEVITDGELLLDVNIFKTPQKQENLRALKVEGDSMSPTLDSGDYVVIDMTKKRGIDGIYVLRRSSDFFMKRLQFDIISDKILIISDNKAYETKSIDTQTQEEFDILGRVIAIIKAV